MADDTGFYEPYASFSKLLRTWLISYGIGLIVLCISQESIIKELITASDAANSFFKMMLGGIIIQVVASFIYKYSMGYLYHAEIDKNLEGTKLYKVADFFSESLIVEILFDLITISLYLLATYNLTNLLLNTT